ncbi:MAG: RNAase [Pseudarcicella sp.]|nr:RNAase [Pseudarcicella sp.]MBP6410824.1 RNAase [Pseudarcicella sp.]
MNNILNKNLFLIKEHVGIFKAANAYNVYDPGTNELLMECREPNLGFFTKLFRFTKYKRMTPFEVVINDKLGRPVLRLSKNVSYFTSTVKVYDDNEIHIGSFKQKFFSLKGKFDVLDQQEQSLCKVEGKWISFEYTFSDASGKLGLITKKWMGLGKELFTSADNYIINIEPTVASNDKIRQMILAASITVDMLYHE